MELSQIMQFISATKEIRLFYLGDIINYIKYLFGLYRNTAKYYQNNSLSCFERNKKKLSCSNENIEHCSFKKLRCNIIMKLKLNAANNCIYTSYLPVCYTPSLYELIFMKSCDVMWCGHCLQKSSHTMVIYMAMIPLTE